MNKLSAEQIQGNWSVLMSKIDAHIAEPRRTQLKDFYGKYAERIMLMPAAHKKEYHNAFPGGYVDHVNRVIDCCLKLHNVWEEMGVDTSTYTSVNCTWHFDVSSWDGYHAFLRSDVSSACTRPKYMVHHKWHGLVKDK